MFQPRAEYDPAIHCRDCNCCCKFNVSAFLVDRPSQCDCDGNLQPDGDDRFGIQFKNRGDDDTENGDDDQQRQEDDDKED